MAARYSLQNIATLQGRKVFFDANVLLYVFWPTGSYNWESNYSSAFGALLRQQNELVVDFIVLSEVINRAIRIEHDKYLRVNAIDRSHLPFKTYRNSPDGKDSLNDIYLIVKDIILPNFIIQGKSFTKAEIESFLQVDTLDIMDKAFIPICKENNCILLTNDRDFAGADIEILSSNPAILRN